MTPNLTPRIALYRGTGAVGWLIKKQSRSVYSHAALLAPGSDNQVLESREFKGVQFNKLTDNDKLSIDWFAIPSMTDQEYQIAFDFAQKQIGMPYDYWSVARFLTKVPARENGKWFCSELVFKSIAEAGLRLLKRIESAEVAPGLLSYSPLLMQVSPPD
ncbi:MAG: YiiX/YebB-like N1pC/P60 family cysteine hydrolase [Verrucomicrobiota bacterium]